MSLPSLLSLALDLPLLRPETKVSWVTSGVLESKSFRPGRWSGDIFSPPSDEGSLPAGNFSFRF